MQTDHLSNVNILRSCIQADNEGRGLSNLEAVPGFDLETSPIIRLGMIGRSLSSPKTITLLSIFRYTRDAFSEGFEAFWPRIWHEVCNRKIDGLAKGQEKWKEDFLKSLNEYLINEALYKRDMVQVSALEGISLSRDAKEKIISRLPAVVLEGRLQDIVRELYAIHLEGDKDFDLRRGYGATQRRVGDILSEAGCSISTSGDMLKGLEICAILQDFPTLQARCSKFIATYARALLEANSTGNNLVYPFYILARQNEGWRGAIGRALATYEANLTAQKKKQASADDYSQLIAASPAPQAATPAP